MRLNGVFNRAKCYFLNTSKRYNEYLESKILSGRLGQQSLLLQPNQLLLLILKSLNYLFNNFIPSQPKPFHSTVATSILAKIIRMQNEK